MDPEEAMMMGIMMQMDELKQRLEEEFPAGSGDGTLDKKAYSMFRNYLLNKVGIP
jgi:hypothetical protein